MTSVTLPNVFAPFLDRSQFVAWTLTNEGKKLPINPITGKPAKANDSSTWTTYDKAIRFNGNLGIELGYGLAGVDIDNCFNDNGILSDMAAEIVSTMNTYTEFSPSGKGLHLLFTYEGSINFSNGKQGRRDSKIGLELYAGAHFLTVTGKPYGELKPIAERTREMYAVYDRYLKEETQTSITVYIKKNVPVQPVSVPKVKHDNSRLWQAMINSKNGAEILRLKNGDISTYETHSEADLALLGYLAFWCRCNTSRMLEMFNESALSQRDKWSRNDYQSSTINQAVTGILRKRHEAFSLYSHADGAHSNAFLGNAFNNRIPDCNQFNTTYEQNNYPHVLFYPLKEYQGSLLMPLIDMQTREFLTLIRFEPDGTAKPYEGLYTSGGAFGIHPLEKKTDRSFLVTGLLSAIALADDLNREADVFCVHSTANFFAVSNAIRDSYSHIAIVPDNLKQAINAAEFCLRSHTVDKVIPVQPNARDWYKLYISERN